VACAADFSFGLMERGGRRGGWLAAWLAGEVEAARTEKEADKKSHPLTAAQAFEQSRALMAE